MVNLAGNAGRTDVLSVTTTTREKLEVPKLGLVATLLRVGVINAVTANINPEFTCAIVLTKASFSLLSVSDKAPLKSSVRALSVTRSSIEVHEFEVSETKLDPTAASKASR